MIWAQEILIYILMGVSFIFAIMIYYFIFFTDHFSNKNKTKKETIKTNEDYEKEYIESLNKLWDKKIYKQIENMTQEDFLYLEDFIDWCLIPWKSNYSEICYIDTLGFINVEKRTDWYPPSPIINWPHNFRRVLNLDNNEISYHGKPIWKNEKILWMSVEEFIFLIELLNKNIKKFNFSIIEDKENNTIWYNGIKK